MTDASAGEHGAMTAVPWTTRERRQAFEDAMREQGKALAQLAFCLCRDRTTAEDVVSEAFARTWGPWQAGRVDDLVPYLRRTVVNLCKKVWRRELVVRRYQSQLAGLLPEETRTRALELVDAVLRLPSSQRAVIVLRYLEEMSEQETAQALGISTGTVKSRTSRALAALRSLYGEDRDA